MGRMLLHWKPLHLLGLGHTTVKTTTMVMVTFTATAKMQWIGHTQTSFSWQRKRTSTLLLWIYLLSLFRHCIHPGLHRNHHCSTSFVVHRQQAWHRSRHARSLLQFNSVLLFAPFQELACSIRAPRHFWAAPRERGIWEKDVCLLWRTMGRKYPDWEDAQYRTISGCWPRRRLAFFQCQNPTSL